MKIVDRIINRLAVQIAKQSAAHHGTSVYLPDILQAIERLTLSVDNFHESYKAISLAPAIINVSNERGEDQ